MRSIMKSDVNKTTMISVKEIISDQKINKLKKPSWITTKLPLNLSRFQKIKEKIRKNNLLTICEEASCPNLFECFNHGTATFMILGPVCTRRCPFCNVHHGRPVVPDVDEITRLSETVSDMALQYVVITSVDRDDLRDGGARYFADCISLIRKKNPGIKIEILVPDFRGCVDHALKTLQLTPPDIFNHNLETIPRLYHQVRPGGDFNRSLRLLKRFKEMHPKIPTKSGLMVGLGETNEEVLEVIRNLYKHGVRMLTIGQYLQPTQNHLPVQRYVTLDEFDEMKSKILKIGFTYAACGPLVRSSYRADLQAKGKEIK